MLLKKNRWITAGLTTAGISLNLLVSILCLPSQSAEQVAVSYELLEFSISTASLETFAENGHIDRELAEYAQYFDESQLNQMRQILTQPIPLSAIEVSQLTYSYFGEESLRFLGDVIRTDAWQNGFHSLRGALILAAAESETLTLINVIKMFPTPTLRIDLANLYEIARDFAQLFEHNNQAINLVAQVSDLDTTSSDGGRPRVPDELNQVAWRKNVLRLFDEHRQRYITVDFYLPSLRRPAPLIIFSHGLSASRDDMNELAEHLTSHGFAVAVVEHPNSNTQHIDNLLRGLAQEVAEPSEFIDRPLDITYLLDELQKRNQSGQLQNHLDFQRIGVVGHSFGGYTALALIGANLDFENLHRTCSQTEFNSNLANASLLLQCSALQVSEREENLRDDRIQAAFVFNSIGSALFGEQGMQQVDTPVFMVAGSEDWIAPPLIEQICPFTWLDNPHKYLALIQGGGHSYTEPSYDDRNDPLSSFTGLSGYDAAAAKQYLQSLSLTFFNAYIQEQADNVSFLSPDTIQSINQMSPELHLINTLSDTQIRQSMNFSCQDLRPSTRHR